MSVFTHWVLAKLSPSGMRGNFTTGKSPAAQIHIVGFRIIVSVNLSPSRMHHNFTVKRSSL